MNDNFWDAYNSLNIFFEDIEQPVRELSTEQVKKLLANIENNNPRYNAFQFEKLFDNNIVWYGYFESSQLVALAAIRPEEETSNYINEVQAFKSGYGKKLLDWIFSNLNKVWLMADPDSSEKLKDYYRQFGLKELNINSNVYNKEISIFMDKEAAADNILVSKIKYWYEGE